MNVTFNTKSITVVLKNGDTSTFTQAIKWNKQDEYLQLFFVVDNELLYTDFLIEDIACIANGEIELLDI